MNAGRGWWRTRPSLTAYLRELLLRLGFEESRQVDHRAFSHAETDTLIVYGPRADEELAPQADVVATRRHLAEKGLLEGEAFSQAVTGTARRARR